MIKALLIALIMSVSVKPGTVAEVNKEIVSIDDGYNIWDIYGDGMHQGEHVNMIIFDNMVIGLL